MSYRTTFKAYTLNMSVRQYVHGRKNCEIQKENRKSVGNSKNRLQVFHFRFVFLPFSSIIVLTLQTFLYSVGVS